LALHRILAKVLLFVAKTD